MASDSDNRPIGAKHLSWSNFRSFRRADLDLARITVLLGRNNSGKSSLHRPLMLLKQTQEIDSQLPGLYGRGPLVDCGGFSDCSFSGRDSSITFRIQSERPIRLSRRTDDMRMELGSIELSFEPGPPLNPFRLARYRLDSPTGTRLLERTLTSAGTYEYHGLICKGNPPNSVFDRAMRDSIGVDDPYHFLFRSNHLVLRAVESHALEEQVDAQPIVLSQFTLKYMALVDAASEWMTSWLAGVHYLGPSRAEPSRTYRLGQFYSPTHADGREVPELIFRILNGEAGLFQGGASRFRSRLARNMRLLGLGGTIDAKEVGEDAFSLHVREPSGAEINIADSAYGFSQVLPLVVRILVSKPGETLVVEQPELHLNPAIQAKLADVLVQGVEEGSHAIIETHSEHLLNRLRTLVALKKLDIDDLAIYFVERGPKQSRVRRVNIDSKGSLDQSWPTGFFGESLREAQALNKAQRLLVKG